MYYSGPARVSGADALAYLREIRYESLLDVGCGTGFLLDGLARQRRAVYKGLDISEGMIDVARGKKIPGAEFVLGSADKLPWKDGVSTSSRASRAFIIIPTPTRPCGKFIAF